MLNEPRVQPWQDGEPVPSDLLAEMKARRPSGELIGIDRLLLKSFPLAKGWNGLLGRVRAEFELPLEHRELIMCRVAVLNRANFEWEVHKPAYLASGGAEAKCEALRATGISDIFTVPERLLLELADQSTRHVDVESRIIEELKQQFGERQTVEAIATVAAYNMVSRFLVALAIE